MDFIVGCNYWASNAGTEMWRQWDENAIREDMEILSAHKIEYLRVFPLWRDFQPVEPMYTVCSRLLEYRLHGDVIPTNSDYLDEVMVSRFLKFCDICQEYGMKLIVGLVTGFMSGRVFIPSAIFGRDIHTDPTALYFQQKYVGGLVRRLKHHGSIVGWDLGNEPGGMGVVTDEFAATNWTSIISNAIRANDPTRPVVSGFNTLVPEAADRKWTIRGQAENCDILTTHPYAYFDKFTYKDRIASFRTSMHGTCENKLYADLSHKPCLVEETGTIGPMVCDDDTAAAYMRVNLFSCWANGSMGVMWWCANEQVDLKTLPYSDQMHERELGLIDRYRNPKPVLQETKRVAEVLEQLPFKLPEAKEDAVCILTKGQEQWGVAYMTYCLAKQAGINLRFAYINEPLPDAKLYLLPSVNGTSCMSLERYTELREKVAAGAQLYISMDNGYWSEFKTLSGLRVKDSAKYCDRLTVTFEDLEIPFSRTTRFELESEGAEILARDSLGYPAIAEYANGKGKVQYVNFPLEAMLLERSGAFEENYCQVYKKLFRSTIAQNAVRTENPNVCVTLHPAEDGTTYCVVINYTPERQALNLQFADGVGVQEVYYGDLENLEPFEATIFRI